MQFFGDGTIHFQHHAIIVNFTVLANLGEGGMFVPIFVALTHLYLVVQSQDLRLIPDLEITHGKRLGTELRGV